MHPDTDTVGSGAIFWDNWVKRVGNGPEDE